MENLVVMGFKLICRFLSRGTRTPHLLSAVNQICSIQEQNQICLSSSEGYNLEGYSLFSLFAEISSKSVSFLTHSSHVNVSPGQKNKAKHFLFPS